jgi:hypothetical protein
MMMAGYGREDRARTEELLRLAILFDNLNRTGGQLLDAGNMVGQNTHVS